MSKLPFLISIPHGGTVVPEGLKSRVKLSPHELLADGDPYTSEIYNMEGDVEVLLKFDVARALIDINRAPNDLPPRNPDGVLKTVSIFNNPVYHNGQVPEETEIYFLLTKYYQPYHAAIREALTNPNILFAFDCHSMESIGPPVARDTGSKRPLFCLGNNNGKACSEEQTQQLAECICISFGLPRKEVTINEPFSGGYITQIYGMKSVPWIQVEMNRSLYLDEYVGDNDFSSSVIKACSHLNYCFRQALRMFSETIS